MASRHRVDLPMWAWLWGPIGLAAFIAATSLMPRGLAIRLQGEAAPSEVLTAVWLSAAVLVGVSILRDWRYGSKAIRSWALFLTLGCVYFLGEELSWGQHIIGWTTPEFWAAINDQGEMNLHNVHGLFDQLPRTLLTGAVMVGTLGSLGSELGNGSSRSRWISGSLPTLVCLPTAVLVILLSARRPIASALGADADLGAWGAGGDVKEMFLAYYLMLYLWSLRVRLGAPDVRTRSPAARAG